MALVPFDINETSGFYDRYYKSQDGDGLAVFKGRRVMDGDGLGSFLGGVFRAVAPTLKTLAGSAVRNIGTQALNVAGDVLNGEDAGQSAVRRLRAAGGGVLSDAVASLSRGQNRKRSRVAGKRKPSKRARTIF